MIVCGTIPTLHTVLSWFRTAASSIKSAGPSQASRSSRKGSSRLTSDGDTDNNDTELAQLRAMAHLSIKTKTTVVRSEPRGESLDGLFDDKNGVRVDMMYDVRRDTRPNSAVPPVEPRDGQL